ncbi:hypothetical protein [Caldanaerobacter subterraneus]|nr:hypothetical protein [Caldanaerobacter subterraneus]
MDKIIKFETHKGLFEQSWGRCLKRGLTPNKKLVVSNVKIVEDSKKYSLVEAFRKSIRDLRDINDFRNFIFFGKRRNLRERCRSNIYQLKILQSIFMR